MGDVVKTSILESKQRGFIARSALLSRFTAIILICTVNNVYARTAPESFAPLAEKLLPAVVNISTTQTVKRDDGLEMPRLPEGSPFEEFFKEFFDRQQRRNGERSRRATSLGSGFVVDPKGLVVTNNHVIEGADEITVIFHDNTRLEATVVGRDKKTDLALLRVKPKNNIAYVSFGDSDSAKVGDWVVAIGNPFGLGGTVTAGIISARARNINAGPYDDFIQTDASINRGNSGGPMFNMQGQVIGINTAIFSPSGGSVGIGFAIPAKLAKPIIDQLNKFGRAKRGWLGVRIQTVTDGLAESLGMKENRGALVANITPGGPAEKFGLKVGDVILQFGGTPIVEMRGLPRAVAETPVGKTVEVVVLRRGTKKTVLVTLGEFPEDEKVARVRSGKSDKASGITSVLGLELSNITPALRKKFNLKKGVKGVVVVGVKAGSAGDREGIRSGDIVRKVGRNQKAPETGKDVKKRVESARKAGDKTVLFLIERGSNSQFVALKLDQAGN